MRKRQRASFDEAEHMRAQQSAPAANPAQPSLFAAETRDYLKDAQARIDALPPAKQLPASIMAITEDTFAHDRAERDRAEAERWNAATEQAQARIDARQPASDLQPPWHAERCCEHDHNADGNCHIHSAPGILRTAPHDLTRAYPRNRDPITSAEAADKASLRMNDSRRAVFQCFSFYGYPMIDEEMIRRYKKERERYGWPKQSDSGLRSRRAELVKMQKLREAGIALNSTGNKSMQHEAVISHGANET